MLLRSFVRPTVECRLTFKAVGLGRGARDRLGVAAHRVGLRVDKLTVGSATGDDRGMDRDEVADELYGLTIDQFTQVRDGRAKELSASGDRETAAEVRKLRKPSLAAWLANTLVRSHREEIEELLDLGQSLRQAQSDARGEDLRILSASRQDLVQRLLRLASEDARVAGVTFSTGIQRQLGATLEAAMADETLGNALAVGRLTDALSHVGFGGGPATDRTHPTLRTQTSNRQDARTRSPGRHDQPDALEAIETRLLDARAAMDAANMTLDEIRTRHESARARRDGLADELHEAEQILHQSSQELQKASRRQKQEARALQALETERQKHNAAPKTP